MYRDLEPTDVMFIKTSLLRSWKDNPRNKNLSAEAFKNIIDTLLETCDVKVICSEEDLDSIFGYAIYKRISKDTLVLHAFLVKKHFQKLGIFSNFLEVLHRNGVRNITITTNLKNTSNMIPYLARKFKIDDRRTC